MPVTQAVCLGCGKRSEARGMDEVQRCFKCVVNSRWPSNLNEGQRKDFQAYTDQKENEDGFRTYGEWRTRLLIGGAPLTPIGVDQRDEIEALRRQVEDLKDDQVDQGDQVAVAEVLADLQRELRELRAEILARPAAPAPAATSDLIPTPQG